MAARLGAHARHLRAERGLTLLDISMRAGVVESTIHEFETNGSFVRRVDAIVAAYATECNTTPEAIWRDAIDRPE